MPCDLRQKRPGNAGNAKGEGNMLQDGVMSRSNDTAQETGLIFFKNQIGNAIDGIGRIAIPGGKSTGGFRFRGAAQKTYLHDKTGLLILFDIFSAVFRTAGNSR